MVQGAGGADEKHLLDPFLATRFPGTVVYQGRYGDWSVEEEDVREVLSYRACLNVSAAGKARCVLNGRDCLPMLALTLNPSAERLKQHVIGTCPCTSLLPRAPHARCHAYT